MAPPKFRLQRMGVVMEPGNLQEIEGVLSPAAARGPDGELYLFPRLVARSNYSHIGIARVRFNEAGDPVGVERLASQRSRKPIMSGSPTAKAPVLPDLAGDPPWSLNQAT